MDERVREVLDKKKKKQYKRMMRRYRKLLKKDARHSRPWDWSFGIDALINFLRWMHDYYKLGYNVWAIDVIDSNEAIHTEKTREDSLKETIYWYDRWMNVDDDFIKIAHTKEELKHYLDLGFHLQEHDEVDKSLKHMRLYYLTLYEDYSKNCDELQKAYDSCKHKFFECIEKYLEEWWD